MSERPPPDSQSKIIVFGARQIRRAWVDGEWFFSAVDIVSALTDCAAPAKYWDAMNRREKELSGVDLSTFCKKARLTGSAEAVNTENAFRIIQSIPSPKAEPFKRWLAFVGYERVQEIKNPELGQQRMKELYRQKGYPSDWIEKRMPSIANRDELEWRKRGIQQQQDFAILTASAGVRAIRRKDTRNNTPTEELRDLLRKDEQKPSALPARSLARTSPMKAQARAPRRNRRIGLVRAVLHRHRQPPLRPARRLPEAIPGQRPSLRDLRASA